MKGLGGSRTNSAGSSRNSNPTPIEDPTDNMATVVDGQYTPLNGRMESEDNGKKRNLLGGTQGDVVELSQLITHPGMRKAESMEVLNLSIHQVCTKILQRLTLIRSAWCNMKTRMHSSRMRTGRSLQYGEGP